MKTVVHIFVPRCKPVPNALLACFHGGLRCTLLTFARLRKLDKSMSRALAAAANALARGTHACPSVPLNCVWRDLLTVTRVTQPLSTSCASDALKEMVNVLRVGVSYFWKEEHGGVLLQLCTVALLYFVFLLFGAWLVQHFWFLKS